MWSKVAMTNDTHMIELYIEGMSNWFSLLHTLQWGVCVCFKWMTSVRDKNYYLGVESVRDSAESFRAPSDLWLHSRLQCGGISTFDTDYILVWHEANIVVVINLVLGIREYNVLFCHDTFYIAKNRSHSPCMSKVLW